MWFSIKNDNLGSKMKVLKFLGIHPNLRLFFRFYIPKNLDSGSNIQNQVFKLDYDSKRVFEN